MALTTENFRGINTGALVIGGSPLTVFSYSTTDAAATVEGAGYFNSLTKTLKKGDIIQAVMVTGGTPVLKHYIVTSATGAATVVIAVATAAAG